MADSEEGTAWWGGWLQTAKEKSMHVMEFMKRDITEFTQTVQADTTSVISTTTQTLKDKLHVNVEGSTTDRVKEGISRMLTSISKGLSALDQLEDEQILNQTEMAIFDRAKARKHNIQIDPGTYCTDPDGLLEEYQSWLETFNLEEQRGNISELLICKTEIRALYTQLVPVAVSHAEFWQRYFYRIHKFEEEEARKAAIMERADLSLDEIAWDEDEEFNGDSSTITVSSKDCTTESILTDSILMTRMETKVEVHCPDIPVSPFPSDSTLVDENTNFDSLNHNIVNGSEISALMNPKSFEDTSIISEANKIPEIEKCIIIEQLDRKDVSKEKLDIIATISEKNVIEKNKSDTCIKEDNSENLGADLMENSQNVEKAELEVTINPYSTLNVCSNTDSSERTDSSKLPNQKMEIINICKSQDGNAVVLKHTEPTNMSSEAVNHLPVIKTDQSPESNGFVLKNKGDMVMIERGRGTPTSIDSLNVKGDTSSGSLDDDWEQEFDLEVTPDDLKLAENAAKELAKTIGLEADDEWDGLE